MCDCRRELRLQLRRHLEIYEAMAVLSVAECHLVVEVRELQLFLRSNHDLVDKLGLEFLLYLFSPCFFSLLILLACLQRAQLTWLFLLLDELERFKGLFSIAKKRFGHHRPHTHRHKLVNESPGVIPTCKEAVYVFVGERADKRKAIPRFVVADAQLTVFVVSTGIDVALLSEDYAVVSASSHTLNFAILKVLHLARA